MNILILHGPNLRLLEGELSFDSIEAVVSAKAKALGLDVKQVQANSEGALLDALVAQKTWLNAIIVNPSSLAATAFGLADALLWLKKPCIEVQLFAEVPNRGRSALKGIVAKQFHGKGVDGYVLALQALAQGTVALKSKVAKTSVNPKLDVASETTSTVAPNSRVAPTSKKTIGRAPATPAKAGTQPTGPQGKTIGPATAAPSVGKVERATQVINDSVITRALLRQRLTDRLSGKVTPSDFQMWCREKWQSLQWGGQVELGQRERLEEALMMLAASNKHTDASLLEFIARLES